MKLNTSNCTANHKSQQISGSRQWNFKSTEKFNDLKRVARIGTKTLNIRQAKCSSYSASLVITKHNSMGRKLVARHSMNRIDNNVNRGPVPAFDRQKLSVWLALTTLISLLLMLSLPTSEPVEAIKLQPEGKEKYYWTGEQFVITCQNNYNIKNVKFRWFGPGDQPITENRAERVHAELAGPHSHKLVVFNATTPTDIGKYQCLMYAGGEKTPREKIDFDLMLFEQTSFMDTVSSVVMPAGEEGTLNCRVKFDPSVQTPFVTWYRNNQPIEMYNDSNYVVQEYDQSTQTSRLQIKRVGKQHDGLYTCKADAITSRLSKTSDHDIRLIANYAPQFDRNSQTIWVERMGANSALGYPVAVSSGRYGQRAQGGRLRPKVTASSVGRNTRPSEEAAAEGQASEGQQAMLSQQKTVRVELRCSCQANPPASIVWTSTRSKLLHAKGEPLHVLDLVNEPIEGPNTTSILVINYNLDSDWEFRSDSYICLASNTIGAAEKRFSIEQGDPPPAYEVDSSKQYNPKTSSLTFKVTGPKLDQGETKPRQVVPPIDLFRIRAEGAGHAAANDFKQHGHSWHKQQHGPSVNFSVSDSPSEPGLSSDQFKPRTYNVSLSSLPSGQQRLYLEAHNAVGWSPNHTYLGEYNVVSGAMSHARALSMGTMHLCLTLCCIWTWLTTFGLSSRRAP